MNRSIFNTASFDDPARPLLRLPGAGLSAAIAMCLSFTLLCTALTGCGNRTNKERYKAEQALFSARKLRDDVVRGSIREPFLERTFQSYRDIVEVYRGRMSEVEGLDIIVVSAQMELAELQFRMGKLVAARDDFEKAIELAAEVPAAKANAIYSCGVISEELRDPETAITYFERFAGDYLVDSLLTKTARMNMHYVKIPIQLSGLYQSIGNSEKSSSWLERAEVIYKIIIETEESEGIRKEVRFNLLTVYLQSRRWERTIEHIDELENIYGDDPNRPSLAYIRAMVEKEGFGNSSRAYDLYMKVYDEYPESTEAPRALLAAADIRFAEKRHQEAREIYRKVVDEYSGSGSEVVQAEWQTARLLEETGQWGEASLKYKEIYQNYPNTEQGMKAPLMVIRNYRDKGEEDAARAAYNQAIEHYGQIVSSQGSILAKIMAESNLVTAHADMQQWEEAADLLLQLPEKYPGYPRFRTNYLMAASIYENELGDRKRASESLRLCMERYPGSRLASEAEKQYRRLEEQK